MITVFGIRIPLPAGLGFLGTGASFLLTLAIWVVIALVVYRLLSGAVRRLARGTRTEVDDVLIRVTRWPFLIVIGLWGLIDSLDIIAMGSGLLSILQRGLTVVIILTITFWVWRFFKEVLIYYGTAYAERTETNVDDVLLPIVNQLAPIVIFIIGVAIALQYLGVNLSTLLVAIGGGAFIAAFALQDSLSNIFSGISLLVDTPFKYGDLILMDDNICVINKIGLRITQLENTSDYSMIYMPNSLIANERLVNITRPTAARKASVEVQVSRSADPGAVKDILEDVANAHPNVLGSIPDKIEAMRSKIERLLPQGRMDEVKVLVKEIKRLEYEHEVNGQIESLHDWLDVMAGRIEDLEERGLNERERRTIRQQINQAADRIEALKRAITLWLMMIRSTLTRSTQPSPRSLEELEQAVEQYAAAVEAAVDEGTVVPVGDIEVTGKETTSVARQLDTIIHRRGFAGLDAGVRDIDLREEFAEVVREWNKKAQLLHGRLDGISQALEAGVERRLDDLTREMRDWVYSSLKETTPEWKYPEATFDNFGQWTFDFCLEFYIDDIRRERFDREQRVLGEVRTDIVERFREAGIDMPVPQSEVRVSSETAPNAHYAPRSNP